MRERGVCCVVSSEASSDFKKHVRQIMDRIQDHLDSYSRNKLKSLENGKISRILTYNMKIYIIMDMKISQNMHPILTITVERKISFRFLPQIL